MLYLLGNSLIESVVGERIILTVSLRRIVCHRYELMRVLPFICAGIVVYWIFCLAFLLQAAPPSLPALKATRRAEISKLISQPAWHKGLPIHLPATFPVSVRQAEHCDSFNATNFLCFIEWDEWMMASALVRPGSAILELGARWGTTSCFLSMFQNNSGRLVSVEPQPEAFSALVSNRETHHCNFYALRGLIGETPLRFHADNYGSRTSSDGEGALVSNVRFEEIEAFVGFQFDTLLIDCEGCIQDLLPLEEHQPLLQNIALILMEEDMAHHLRQKKKYEHWHGVFVRAGFQCIWHSHNNYDPGNAAWSWELRHRAWIRPERFGPWTGCDAFALQNGLGIDRLQCVGMFQGNPLYTKPT